MSDKVQQLTDQSFQTTVIENGKEQDNISLVDFWAEWCGPCKAIAPVLEELANEIDNVHFYKLNIDENQETPAKYQVRAIPTLVLFKKGEVIETIVGVNNKATLEKKIKAHL